MPDITMCKGTACPKKESCYRFKATPSEFRQSYFANAPTEGGACKYYWAIETKEKKE
jgi:hypothetical protein